MNRVLIIYFLLFSGVGFAAIPNKSQVSQPPSKLLLQQDVEAALMALRLPHENRLRALRAQGEKSFSALLKLAQDPEQGLQVRWKAMTSIGRIYPQQSKEFLTKSLKDEQWFIRNAALLGLAAGSRARGIAGAKLLVSDPALVVRTAAVQTLEKLKANNVQGLLWRQLNHKQNFRNGKSLWIRKHIVKALANMAHRGEEMRFAQLLHDSDPRVQVWAIYGLERLRGQQVANKNMPLENRRQKWMAWAKENGMAAVQ